MTSWTTAQSGWITSIPKKFNDTLWVLSGVVVAIAVLFDVVLPIARDAGIALDEPINIFYGRYIARAWGIPTGPLEQYRIDQWKFYYTGFYVTVHAVLAYLLPQGSVFEGSHLANVILVFPVLCGALFYGGYLIGGARGGALALGLGMTFPRLIGQIPLDPKDPPFVALYAATVAYLLQMMKKSEARLSSYITLGTLSGLCLNTRIQGVWSIVASFLVLRPQLGPKWPFKILALILPSVVLLYLTWPMAWSLSFQGFLDAQRYAVKHPLAVPLRFLDAGLNTFSAGPIFVVGWILIGSPLVHLVTFLSACTASLRMRFQGALARQRRVLVLAYFFPFLIILATPLTRYHGLRHILFLIPGACWYITLVATRVSLRSDRSRVAVSAATATIMLVAFCSVLAIARELTPYVYTYVNHSFIAKRTACNQLEREYWATSLRELGDKVDAPSTWKLFARLPSDYSRVAFTQPEWQGVQLVGSIDAASLLVLDHDNATGLALGEWSLNRRIGRRWRVERDSCVFAEALELFDSPAGGQ